MKRGRSAADVALRSRCCGGGGAGGRVEDVTDDVRVIKGIRRRKRVGMGGEFQSKNLKGSDTHTSIQLNYFTLFFRCSTNGEAELSPSQILFLICI